MKVSQRDVRPTRIPRLRGILTGAGPARRSLLLLLCLALVPGAFAQRIEFRQALEAALTHSTAMGIAKADQVKAHYSYLQARNVFIPHLTFGSGIAQTWGYPMSIEGSAPSLFNVTSQSSLVNWAQSDFLHAAKVDRESAGTEFEDQRQATLLETALTYMQLDRASAQAQALQQELEQAGRLQTISRQRLQAGIDSKLDLTRASLSVARVRMRLTQLQGNMDLLRQRLAQLTGYDARELDTDSGSIPPLPEINHQEDMAARAVQFSPAVKAAEEKAQSMQFRAKGEHKLLYPAVDLVGNYGLFTKYNNLDLLFPSGKFSRNNATFGVAIRFPFINATQRAQAASADAEALKAKTQAEAVRQQVSNDALRWQRTVEQLADARQVAELEYQLAEADAEAVQARTQLGTATIKDQEDARIAASDKQAALFDAQFQLQRACLQLLRLTGELETWALH
jgi:outer membrane protein TolC